MKNKYSFIWHKKRRKRNFDTLYFSILTTLMEAVPPVDEIDISDKQSLQIILNFLVSFSIFINNV